MEFTTESVSTRDEQRAVVRVQIEGEAIPGRRGGGRWVPSRATITWERSREDGGPWSEWLMLRVHVVGQNLRADGSWGAEVRERLYGRPTRFDGPSVQALEPVYDAAVKTRPADREGFVRTSDEPLG